MQGCVASLVGVLLVVCACTVPAHQPSQWLALRGAPRYTSSPVATPPALAPPVTGAPRYTTSTSPRRPTLSSPPPHPCTTNSFLTDNDDTKKSELDIFGCKTLLAALTTPRTLGKQKKAAAGPRKMDGNVDSD